jgi:hypothetical protein
MNKGNEILIKKATLIKIAIDMHLRNYRVVRQIDQSSPQPAQKFTPEGFYLWLEKQRGWASEWWCATRRAVLGMSRRGGWEGWEWKSL